ncbi:MAG: orotidine 5'-phosphate decarboxylase [Elusimicrobiota bacterium]|nr:orotidine 5'-phosphate decarboxylase [Elusimicrobiota bacterium]
MDRGVIYKEPKQAREITGGKIIIPAGIRPLWAVAGDQKRVMTPKDAIKAGADFMVIGRPITAHKNPPEAAGRRRDIAFPVILCK